MNGGVRRLSKTPFGGSFERHSVERRDSRLGTPEQQRVYVVRALQRIDSLEIEKVPYDVKFIRYAVAAQHVARRAGYIQGLAGGVALEQRDHLRGGFALLAHPGEMQACEQPERDFGLHIRELLLHQLIRRQRPAELLAVERVLARRMP